jgi:hypothetical protein
MGINFPMHHPPRPGQTATITATQVGLFSNASSGTAMLIEGNNIGEGTSPSVWAVVANAGAGQVQLNTGTDTGALWSVGQVTVPLGALIVHGALRTENGTNATTPTEVSGAVIEPPPAVSLDRQLTTITATFPVLSGSNITHSSGTATINPGAITGITVTGGILIINPGSYGDLIVNGGTVRLVPGGTYTFTNITFNSGSGAGFLQSSNGANSVIKVNVRFNLIFRGGCTTSTTAPNGYETFNLRFAAFGSATIGARVNPDSNPFRGTVVCMNGSCVIEDSNRTYQGAFFGQTVTVHANASIQHVGFVAPPTGWETPTG